jgi:phosphocarrier protein HPr
MAKVKTFEIKNKMGMHARPAAKLANVSGRFKSKISLVRDGQQVNAKSVLSILTLACPCGSQVTVRASGPDAEEAVDALEKLIEDKFGEE